MELTTNTIINLMNNDNLSPKISVYVPTHAKSTSQSMNEDRIQLKNALQSIEHDPAFSDEEVRSAYAHLQPLLTSTDFWRHQAASLAIFADADGYQVVHLGHQVAPYVCIDERFAVSPLIALSSMNANYYLLDVNLDTPRLFAGTDYGLVDIGADTLPGAMDDTLDIDERNKSLDFRSGDAQGSNMFYGHGSAEESRQKDIDRYLRILADATMTCLSGKSDQLLLAGTVDRVAQFRPLLAYQPMIEDVVPLNRGMSLPGLHAASRPIAARQVIAERVAAIDAFRGAQAERTVDGSAAALNAARHGKVDTLLLPVIRMTTDGIGAAHDLDPQPLVEPPQHMDEFETAVRAVAAQGGAIIAVEQREFAEDPTMKALLRF